MTITSVEFKSNMRICMLKTPFPKVIPKSSVQKNKKKKKSAT